MSDKNPEMFTIMGEVPVPSHNEVWWYGSALLLIAVLLAIFLLVKRSKDNKAAFQENIFDIYIKQISGIAIESIDSKELYKLLSQVLKLALSELSACNYNSLTNEELHKILDSESSFAADKARLMDFFSLCQNILYENGEASQDQLKNSQALVLDYLKAARGDSSV